MQNTEFVVDQLGQATWQHAQHSADQQDNLGDMVQSVSSILRNKLKPRSWDIIKRNVKKIEIEMK